MTDRLLIAALAAASAVLPALPCLADAYDCLMDPSEIIELGSAGTGVLSEVTVNRGDEVQAGEVVARLNSAVEQSTVDLLRVRATSTAVIDAQREQLFTIEKRHERVVQLKEKGIASEEDLDQAEAELIAARSNLFQAELNQDLARMELARAEVILGQRTVRSPLGGIVQERTLNSGEYVGSDDHILKIVRLDPLRIEAFLPVSLYGAIAAGDQATVTPVEPLTGEYVATVTAVDRVFDAASATFTVFLELPNPDGLLPAGHRCRLTVKEP